MTAIRTRNATFQHVETLKRNRAKRTSTGELVVEGVIPIDLCLARGIEIRMIFGRRRSVLSRWGLAVIDRLPGAELYELSDELMAELSGKEDPSEIILVALQPRHDLADLALDRIVVLDRPSNPGNLGAILRSSNAFGVDAVVITGHGSDPYDPKCITASRGTVFSLPVTAAESNAALDDLFARMRAKPGFTVYGSSANGSIELGAVPRSARWALIIGNETFGMSERLRELAEVTLTIPMHGDASSLNVACATSILLYELTKS
jgi:23S rRNA (uridine2479-2'-O)-methyltransferase